MSITLRFDSPVYTPPQLTPPNTPPSEDLEISDLTPAQIFLPLDLPIPQEQKEIALTDNQQEILEKILTKNYSIQGKNHHSLNIHLLSFLCELEERLKIDLPIERTLPIALIGSTVGHIIEPIRHADQDFLIQLQIPIDHAMIERATQPKQITFVEGYIENQVTSYCNQIRLILEACLAKQMGQQENDFNVLKEIGNNYFSKSSIHNHPIDFHDLSHPSDNRCCIFAIGPFEFKFSLDLHIKDKNTLIAIVPGLINASAFDHDDMRIYLPAQYLFAKQNDSLPALSIYSYDIPIEEALNALIAKKLHTKRIHGRKCLKGIANITFKGHYYAQEDTHRAILSQFVAMSDAPRTLRRQIEKYKDKNYVSALLCSMNNFYISAANLNVDISEVKPPSDILDGLFPPLPGELVFSWHQLSFLLHAKPAEHTADLLVMQGKHQTYYVIKPKAPVPLLHNFLQMVKKYPNAPLKQLFHFGVKFQSIDHLISETKLHLKPEDLIPFNHCILTHNSSALDKEQDLEFKMLVHLLTTLPHIPSSQQRQELIEKTELFFEKKDCNASELFQSLLLCANAGGITSSCLFRTCIQALTHSEPKSALALWDYADKEMLFANSPVDELEAYACIQKIGQPEKLHLCLENMLFRLRSVKNKLTEESTAQCNSFNSELLSLAGRYLKEEFQQENLPYIQSLPSDIASLPIEIKDQINSHIQSAILGFNPKNLQKNEQEALFEILTTVQKSSSLSTLYLACIQDLVTSAPKKAIQLWSLADKEMIFADSPAERLKAFTCIHKMRSQKVLNKKQCITNLEEMLFELSLVSHQLNPESNAEATSFNAQLLSYVQNLTKEECSFKELDFLQNLLHDIAPLPAKQKNEIAEHYLDSFFRFLSQEQKEADQKSTIVESSLQNPLFIEALLRSKEQQSQRILKLFSHSKHTESTLAIQNLGSLFHQIYTNISLSSSIESKNPEIEMLKLLCQMLPDISSLSLRKECIQQTEFIFKEKNISLDKLFEHLGAQAKVAKLTIPALYLTCILELAVSSEQHMLSALWRHSGAKRIFADAPEEELNAFICMQELELKGKLNKKQLLSLVSETTDRFSTLSSKMNVKNSIDPIKNFASSVTCKISHETYSFEELQTVQKFCSSITSFEGISTPLKEEIAKTFIDAFIKCDLPTEKWKREQAALLEILKWSLDICSEESAKKVMQQLKAHPEIIISAGQLLNTPHFTTTLMEAMKQGTFDDNIQWFSFLNKEKCLRSNDQNTFDCSAALLAKWKQKPNRKLYKQVLPAFQLIKLSLEKTKGTSETLKIQGQQAYVDFVKGCLNAGLKEEAEGSLFSAAKWIDPQVSAELLNTLMLAQTSTQDVENLFLKGLKQKILSQTTPASLLLALHTVLKDVKEPCMLLIAIEEFEKTTPSSKKIPPPTFVEKLIQDPTVIQLLLDPNTGNANEIILQLINSTHQIKSTDAVRNLIQLFKQLYKNRRSNEDTSLDQRIYTSTHYMFRKLAEVETIDCKQWLEIIEELKKDRIIFKDQEKLAKQLFNSALRKMMAPLSTFVDKNFTNPKKREEILKLIPIYEKYQSIPLLPDDYDHFEKTYLSLLHIMKCDYLSKLKSMDVPRRYEAIQRTITLLLEYEQQQNNCAEEGWNQIFALLGECYQQHPSKETLKLTVFENQIPRLLAGCTEKHHIFIISKALEILKKLHSTYPEQFTDIKHLSNIVLRKATDKPLVLLATVIAQDKAIETYQEDFKVFKEYETLPLHEEDYLFFQKFYLEYLVLIGQTKTALIKLQLMAYKQRFPAIQQLLCSFILLENEIYRVNERYIEQILKMLDECCQNHPSKETIKFTILEKIANEIFDTCSDQSHIPIIGRTLGVLEKLIKNHQDKFENLEKVCDRIISTSFKFRNYHFAFLFLNYAEERKILHQDYTLQAQRAVIDGFFMQKHTQSDSKIGF